MVTQVYELLSSLENVNFKIPGKDEQISPAMESHYGEKHRSITQTTPNKHLLKPNILHPTTKTFTPSYTSNTPTPLKPTESTPHNPQTPTPKTMIEPSTLQAPVPLNIPQKTQISTPSQKENINIYTVQTTQPLSR